MKSDMVKEQHQRAEKLHCDSLVIDLHSDVHLEMLRSRGRGEKKVLERLYYDKWKKGGVNAVVLNTMSKFGLTPYPYYSSPTKNLLLTSDAIAQEVRESPEYFVQVFYPDDIIYAHESNKIGLILGTEGAEPFECEPGLLRCFYQLGLRVITLTWHQRNLVADGVSEPSNSGLSNFGKELVEEMNRLGIIIDVSHLSRSGVDDVIEFSNKPVIASHSNTFSICSHQRNLQDEQIIKITEKGGLIGVVFLGRFVHASNPKLSDVLDHVDHIKDISSWKNIGIGPDFVGSCEDMIIQSRRIAGPGQPVNDTGIPFAKGLELITSLPNFTKGLVRKGYSDEQIKGILGTNFMRIFKTVSC